MLIPLLTAIAPFIAKTLISPLANTAIAYLGKTFLNNENATEDDLKEAFGMLSQEDLSKLKRLDGQFQAEMRKLGLEESILTLRDRERAREKEIKLNDWVPAVLALLITLGYFGLIVLLILYKLPQPVSSVVNIMVGGLGTAWIGVIGYYFGSTVGSKMKTNLLTKSIINKNIEV